MKTATFATINPRTTSSEENLDNLDLLQNTNQTAKNEYKVIKIHFHSTINKWSVHCLDSITIHQIAKKKKIAWNQILC